MLEFLALSTASVVASTFRRPARGAHTARAAVAMAFLLAMAPPSGAQKLEFPMLPGDAPVGEGVAVSCNHPELKGTARCGRFRVYEDREGMSGPTIDLAFVVLEALDADARVEDAIVPLPGGPGQSFTDQAVLFSRIMPAEQRRRRDVLLVDVRGVGRSGSLSCRVDYPRGPESRFGTLFPVDHAVACRDELSRRARLDRYTTASSVDDLEDLRRWLGYAALNLSGGSYGTRVAQVYMRRHPDAVRTVVLNGVAPVAEPLYVQHAFLLQRALDQLVDECRSDVSCHAAYPDLDEQLAGLLERFAKGPVEVEMGSRTVPFSIGDLSYVLRGFLYGQAAALPMLIDRAAAGELAPLAEYYLQRTAWVSDTGGYHFSVLCAEDIAPLTDEDVARATRGTFMGDHLIQAYRRVCDLWPHAELPASHWEPVVSEAPTLLLSGGRDPVTPPEGAEAVARHLPNSLHVVVPNGGHGVGGPCIAEMMRVLVETARLDDLDPSCIQAASPTNFRVPDGG
jgi:pimeloyl-ACP methyl ester carboxylesterase